MKKQSTKEVYLAGGCFWGTEKYLSLIPGVIKTDVGTQYRTGIYYVDPSDEDIINDSINKLQSSYKEKVLVEIMPLKNYYSAEEYHQKYLDKNVNGYCHIGQDNFIEARLAKDPALNP